MRVAMIGQKGIPAIYGGIERHVEELSVHLVERGVDVSVYCRPWYGEKSKIKNQKSKIYKGVKLVFLPSFKTKHLDAISHTFLATLHALFCKYDAIHYHGVGPALLSWLPRILRPKIKIITTFHCIDRKHQKWGMFAKIMLRIGEWAACRFAHKTITVSKTLRQYCAEAYDKETVYIPNGVPIRELKIKNRESGVLKDYNLEPNKYLLMVSRLVRHKGAHYLISAFRNLKEKNKNLEGLKIVFAGDSSFTDDYVKSLKEFAGGRDDVVFTGFQSGRPLEDLFLNCLAVVHPSESEGLPIAVLEAMSYGKVVLASDIPENMELVGDYGMNFRNKDIDDLMEKLESLIEKDDLGAQGEIAKEFVASHYNWENISLQIKQLYQGI